MQKTSIEWCTHSSNPIYAIDRETGKRGWHCVHASDGCRNCYSEALNKRFGTGLTYTVNNDKRVEFRLNRDEFGKWAKLKTPARIFIGDMLDLFHKDISFDFLLEIFMAIRSCPQHTFLVLTKRPERMKLFFETWFPSAEALANMSLKPQSTPPNAHLGVSCEDQKTADERIPLLLQTPAAVRWISAEPLLDRISFRWADWVPLEGNVWHLDGLKGISWVVVGGESGPGARPFNLQWAEAIVEQCQEAGVSVFVKQLGANPYRTGTNPDTGICTMELRLKDKKGGNPNEWPSHLRVREYPAPEGVAS